MATGILPGEDDWLKQQQGKLPPTPGLPQYDGSGIGNTGQDARGGAYDLDAFYQKTFGRAPDANERATDMANISKYGAAGFEQDAQKRLGGQQGPQYQTPAQQWNAQPAMQPQQDQLYKMLMERASQPLASDRNDPAIRAQVDPLVAQSERASRNAIDDIAEKAGPLANLTGERRLAGERQGQAAGQLEAEVMGRERDRGLQENMQALQLYGDQMSGDKRNALEREIAYLMDASRTADRGVANNRLSLDRDQMNLSNDEFLRELALREWMAGDASDQGWAGMRG